MTEFYEDPKFMAWLAGRKPRDELIVRMALRDHIRDPSTGQEWEARIDALLDELKPDEVELAELLHGADAALREIANITVPDAAY
jgi:hypothetical protein